jgi:hypothetical protein
VPHAAQSSIAGNALLISSISSENEVECGNLLILKYTEEPNALCHQMTGRHHGESVNVAPKHSDSLFKIAQNGRYIKDLALDLEAVGIPGDRFLAKCASTVYQERHFASRSPFGTSA